MSSRLRDCLVFAAAFLVAGVLRFLDRRQLGPQEPLRTCPAGCMGPASRSGEAAYLSASLLTGGA